MSTPNVTRWIGVGLLGLPLYGVLNKTAALTEIDSEVARLGTGRTG